MSKLTKLTELSLYICAEQLDPCMNKLFQVPALKSVTTLYLEVSHLSLDQFFTWIPTLFPNVTNLTLKSDYEDCRELEQLREGLGREFSRLQRFKLKSAL